MDSSHPEENVYGKNWNSVHAGYFSDPAIAAPLIEKIRDVIRTSKPDIMVDLGGGTGFLLRELDRQHAADGIQLVNLDVSPTQLAAVSDARIRTLQRSLTDFVRADAGPASSRFLFLMRSVLHYYGKSGLKPALHHLRQQMRPGEVFIHQTACNDASTDTGRLNLLYERMQTGKWYPTTAQLVQALEHAGWTVTDVSPAPPLVMTDRELSQRYSITSNRLIAIRDELSRKFGEKRGVFKLTQDGFRAYLHYKLFTCIVG